MRGCTDLALRTLLLAASRAWAAPAAGSIVGGVPEGLGAFLAAHSLACPAAAGRRDRRRAGTQLSPGPGARCRVAAPGSCPRPGGFRAAWRGHAHAGQYGSPVYTPVTRPWSLAIGATGCAPWERDRRRAGGVLPALDARDTVPAPL